MPLSIHDPELSLADIMQAWPPTIAVFLRYRMVCVGCVIARFHTVADACREHEVDEAEFRAALAAVATSHPGTITAVPSQAGQAGGDQ